MFKSINPWERWMMQKRKITELTRKIEALEIEQVRHIEILTEEFSAVIEELKKELAEQKALNNQLLSAR